MLLFVGTGFAASGEGDGDVAATAQRQRALSDREIMSLKDFLAIQAEDKMPSAILNAALYFAQSATEDGLYAAMARIKSMYVPEEQELNILNTYFAWLQGDGKNIEAGSANDPLTRLAARSRGWADDDFTNQFRSLLNITETDVRTYATAAKSLGGGDNDNDSDSGSEDAGGNIFRALILTILLHELHELELVVRNAAH